MTEGNGRSLGSEASLGQEITDTDVLNCPVCGDELKSLRKLNAHLDTVHGFNDGSPSDTDVDSSRESSVIGLNTLEQSVADKSDSAKPRDVQYKGSILQEYENLHNLEVLVTKLLPQFNECVNKIHENTTPDEKLVQDLAQLRRKLLQNLTLYDKISKKLIHMDVHSQAELKIQQSIASHASTFIEEKMLPLKRIPDVFTPASEEIKVTSSSDLLFNNLTIAEVKRYREELMVLKEQRYLVETMLNSAAKERRFEEAITLKSNLAEIDKNVKNLESRLGDEGFD
ncbi:Vacuolar segregation protein PEP7 [Kluyveromyces marxianus]